MSRGETTTDHETIRKWTEKRGELKELSREESFDKFEDAGLAFLFQEKTADGATSRFHKFISRSSAAHAR